MEIKLTQEELDAFTEMGVGVESYLKSVAQSHISQKLNEEWTAMPREEKVSMLTKKTKE
jgi:hypothetical protein